MKKLLLFTVVLFGLIKSTQAQNSPEDKFRQRIYAAMERDCHVKMGTEIPAFYDQFDTAQDRAFDFRKISDKKLILYQATNGSKCYSPYYWWVVEYRKKIIGYFEYRNFLKLPCGGDPAASILERGTVKFSLIDSSSLPHGLWYK